VIGGGEGRSLRLRFNIIVYNQRIKIDKMKNNEEYCRIFSMEKVLFIKIAFPGSKLFLGWKQIAI